MQARASQAVDQLPELEQRPLVVVAASDPSIYPYLLIRRDAEQRPRPAAALMLTTAPIDLDVERADTDTLRLRAIQGAFVSADFERLYRGDHQPWRVGDRVTTNHFTVTVEALEVGGGGRPTVLRFDFLDGLLDRANVVAWQAGALAPFALPAVGEGTTITHTPGPSGL